MEFSKFAILIVAFQREPYFACFKAEDFTLENRKGVENQKIKDENIILTVKKNLKTTQTLAEKFNVTQPTISKHLKKIGLIQNMNYQEQILKKESKFVLKIPKQGGPPNFLNKNNLVL